MEPGCSLNFDPVLPLTSRTTTHEEDEAAEDAKIKEKELQDLLTNAFDDLIDDDDDVDSERNQDSACSENYSRDGLSRRQMALASTHVSEHDSANYSDTGFRPMEPFAGDTAGSPDGVTESRWEDQYYVDRLSEFEPIGGGQVLDVSGGQLSDRTSGESGRWFERGGADDDVRSDIVRQHPTDRPQAQAVDFGQASFGNRFVAGGADEVASDIVRQHPTDRPQALAVEFCRASAMGGSDSSQGSQQFFVAGQNGETNIQIKYQQLNILYAARGRELQRLRQDFEAYQRDWTDEVVNLQAQLGQAKDNEQDYTDHLREYQEKLTLCNGEIAELRGQMRTMEIQLLAVTDNRKEIVLKLQASESTIEGLQAHVGELEQCESLLRAKEHHSAFVNSMQGRHNDELYRLKSEIEQLKENLEKREGELVDLRKSLNQMSHECEATKIDKAETVNRLIRALEQSQQECQRMVTTVSRNSGTNGSGSRAASPEEANERDDHVIEALKNELLATKQELELFVRSTRLGICGCQNVTGSQPNLLVVDSPSASPTPAGNRAASFRPDSLLTSLKSEVERSLLCLQRKNEQLQRAQNDCRAAQDKLKECQQESQASEIKLHVTETKLQQSIEAVKRLAASSTVGEASVLEERRRWLQEKTSLESELARCQTETVELGRSRTSLQELVRKLREETEATREAGELAKQEAVAECREVCLRLHADAVAAIRDECRQHIEEARADHSSRVDSLTRELDGVKSVYVKVCEEKDQVEDRLYKEFQEEKSKEIENLKKIWLAEKEGEMRTFEKKVATKYRSRGQSAAGAGASESSAEKEAEVESRLSAHLANAKLMWAREQELVVQQQVVARVKEMVRNIPALGLAAADQSEIDIDDNLEHIKELEKRVRDTESMYKRHVADLETTLRKNSAEELERLRAQLSDEKRSALRELAARKDRDAEDRVKRVRQELERERSAAVDAATRGRPVQATEADKVVAETELRKDTEWQERLQALTAAKEEEARVALVQQEDKLCSDLEQFLVDQKQRYMSALQSVQDSHVKEMTEVRQNYDTQIQQLNDQCRSFAEKQERERDSCRYDRQRQDAEAETVILQRAVDAASDKCRKLEAEATALVSEHRRRLRDKELELEQAKARCEDVERSAALRHESAVAPLTRQVAALQAEAIRCRELEEARLSERESAHVELVTRHRTLKDKVRKYHRYIHAKEREFSDTLVQLNAEHSTALERIALLRFEVPQILEEKLDGLRREFLHAVLDGQKQQLGGSGGAGGEMESAGNDGKIDHGPVLKMVDDAVIEQLMDKFGQSLKQVHADTLQYLDECSEMATTRVREEIALATCLVSQHLVTPSPNHSSKPATSQLVHRPMAATTTTSGLESVSTLSSGHGTMVSGSNRSVGTGQMALTPSSNTVRGAKSSELPSSISTGLPWTSGSVPDKYWSSTPYQRDAVAAPARTLEPGGAAWTPKAGDLTSQLLGRLVNQRLLMSLEGATPRGANASGKSGSGSEDQVTRDCVVATTTAKPNQ